jgi:oxygen-independent coproporphyrinogen-3 oxidase
MFCLPQQDTPMALADLEAAVELGPEHLSWYQLTLEPNTLFHHRPPALPDEDEVAAMYEAGQARLAAAGYRQYEVSAYAREGWRCRHNVNYWTFGDYLGIGAGAHGKISEPGRGAIARQWRLRHPRDYLSAAGTPAAIAGERDLGRHETGFEFMLNALRLTDGFDTGLFAAHTGQPMSVVEAPLREAEARGLLDWDLHHVRPTATGRRFLDDVVGLFLPDSAGDAAG